MSEATGVFWGAKYQGEATGHKKGILFGLDMLTARLDPIAFWEERRNDVKPKTGRLRMDA